MNRKWSDAEKEFVRNNANTMKDGEMALKLSKISGRIVTLQAVRKQRQKLGIAKKPGRGICATVKGRFIKNTKFVGVEIVLDEEKPEKTS